MKLVDITPYFHSKSGGIKRYLLEKAKYLRDKNIEHVLIIPGKERKSYYLESTKVYELPSFPLPLTGGYRFFSSLAEIRQILQRESPDIVEVGGSYQPLPYLKSHQYLLSVFYHSDIRADLSLIPGPQRLKNLFLEHTVRKKLSKADLILVPSKKQEEFLKGFDLERVITINLGVDTQTFNPSRKNPYFDKILGIEKNKYKLLYVGRLSIDKNVSLLLEVFQHIDPSLFHLVIAGDGPLRKRVESLSKKLPNLTYLGYVHKEEELAELYASCDIYVSASLRETYGLSFLEAQACGCILVAFDMGLETQPFKEFLAKDVSQEELYKAIIKASNALSLPLKEAISSYIASNFSWTSTFERLIDVYSGQLLTKS
ncbi:MAG: glycosyltransferase [Aquificaceae bacterium]